MYFSNAFRLFQKLLSDFLLKEFLNIFSTTLNKKRRLITNKKFLFLAFYSKNRTLKHEI